MIVFYIFISIVFGILNIVLFFKIWGMTNDVSIMRNNMGEDVSRIRDVLERIYYSKSRDKVDSSTKIELYSWIKAINPNQDFQIMEIIDENTFVCVNKKFPNGLKLRRANIEFVIDESGNKVDSSTVFDKEGNAVKANIELYSWVKEVKSNQEFQVIEIIDEETFLCVNEKHQDGIKLKRTEIELVMV